MSATLNPHHKSAVINPNLTTKNGEPKIDPPQTLLRNRYFITALLRLFPPHIFSGASIPSNSSTRTNSRSTISVIASKNARFSASPSDKIWCL